MSAEDAGASERDGGAAPGHLSLPLEEVRALGYRVVDLLVEHARTVGSLPPIRTATPEGLRERLAEPAPEAPGDAPAALARLTGDVLPYIQHGDHPRFFARVPSPSNAVSAVADALGAGLNVFAGSWTGGSGPAALELVVLGWLRDVCGLPEDTEGILVSGGSVGTLTALAAALAARPELDRARAVAYCSDQTHASVLRALRLLGVGDERIRRLPTDAGFRVSGRAVDEAVEEDAARGLEPWLVVANAGTTNTGAVDPLHELADLGARRKLWLHADGAYGAPARLTARGRALLDGLERADSIVLDPHKWLFQPYEIGCVLVRRPGALRRAFTMAPEYLRDVLGVGDEEVSFRDRGPQLTRGSRALKLWLSVQTFGLAAFRAAIDRGIDLAERAERRLRSLPAFEVVTPAQLAVVTFRWTGTAPGLLDARNAELVERVVADGFCAPSSTVLRGRTVLRLCTINPRTTDAELDASIDRIASIADRLQPGEPPCDPG